MTDASKLRVLIADDEYMIALDFRDAVQDLGHETLGPVATVREALAIIGQDPPDVALLDETLADGSVGPVATELSRRDIPFAIVSGHELSPSDVPLLRNAMRLPKPTEPKKIQEALDVLVSAGE